MNEQENLITYPADGERSRLLRPGMDRRRAFAVLLPWGWLLPLSLLLGAVIGILLYLIYSQMQDPGPLYTKKRELYIDFAFNEKTKETYDYYNAYTWNDIAHTERILGTAFPSEEPSLTYEEAYAAIRLEMPSDIRLIHLIVTHHDPEIVDLLTERMTLSLETFAQEMDEFERIYVLDPGETKPVPRILKTGRAAEAGAILAFLIAIIGMGLFYSVDDRILVPNDLIPLTPLPVYLEKPEGQKDLPLSYDQSTHILRIPFGTRIGKLQTYMETLKEKPAGILITNPSRRFYSLYDKRMFL
ncbi:MAG: hypothetical protein IJU50_10605 [Lachnospiraceae bacterium]|nr:hypothetical protein [Lachnospiraceae bacterium]